jgi:eukaryotic-like serine/threonine-protein kinase
LLDKDVAIKVMSGPALGNAEARERFLKEMRAGGKLDHPNIVKTHDADKAGDLLYLVMEYVEGISLERQVKRNGPLPVRYACDFAAQAAIGLQHALDKRMAHRDIKPANLIVTKDKQVKILDFGLVRLQEEGKDRKTQFQSYIGTAEYIAPEQAMNARQADIRADIYSLGCTLYFLLSGRPPFLGETFMEVAAQHITDPLPPLANLPAGLWEVIERMTVKDAAERYQTPADVVEALEPYRRSATGTTQSGSLSIVTPPPPLPPAEFRGLEPAEPSEPRRNREGASWAKRAILAGAVATSLIAAGVALTLEFGKDDKNTAKKNDPTTSPALVKEGTKPDGENQIPKTPERKDEVPTGTFQSNTVWVAINTDGSMRATLTVLKRSDSKITVHYQGPVNEIVAEGRIEGSEVTWTREDVSKVIKGKPFSGRGILREQPTRLSLTYSVRGEKPGSVTLFLIKEK